jgi:hypothetical protein
MPLRETCLVLLPAVRNSQLLSVLAWRSSVVYFTRVAKEIRSVQVDPFTLVLSSDYFRRGNVDLWASHCLKKNS